MELGGEDFSPRNRASKRRAIVDGADGQRSVRGHRMEAVREVEAPPVLDTVPKRMRTPLAHRAPAHMRDFQALAVRSDHPFLAETHDAPRNEAKALGRPLFTVVEQHLQTEADAEKRPVAHGV